ncbi:MAG: hypothetical protein KatS3mg068_0718 [Candidatus Sericytochromatia bacterium]|nr:MAG: hypothetical protein KatS3mg068_0718 [Candidatus Sericytochromatia bacterium]
MNKVEEIINFLESKKERNMGQVTLYVKTGVCKIQKRGEGNFIVYFFDNKLSKLGLDIKDANRFLRMNKEQLIGFLNSELDE